MKLFSTKLGAQFIVILSSACASSDPTSTGSVAGAGGAAVAGGGGATGGIESSAAGAGGSAGGAPAGGNCEATPPTATIIERTCAEGTKLSSKSEGDISHANRTAGTNGAFVDECDCAGVLTEFVCEAPFTCSGQCSYVQTGQVVPVTTKCAVGCKNGACTTD